MKNAVIKHLKITGINIDVDYGAAGGLAGAASVSRDRDNYYCYIDGVYVNGNVGNRLQAADYSEQLHLKILIWMIL